MRRASLEWPLAFFLAVAAHLAIAAGFIGGEGVKMERGAGDNEAAIIGSITDAISNLTDVEPVTEAGEDTETIAEEHPVDELSAEMPPQEHISPEPASDTQTPPPQPVREARLAERAPDVTAAPDAVLPPEPKKIEAETPAPANGVAAQPVHDEADLKEAPSVKPEQITAVTPETVQPQPPQSAPVRKPKKRVKQTSAARPTASPAARRSGAERQGRSGGGRGSGGKALQSNYQGRVIAHLRRYKSYPREARRRRLKGLVRVRFTINASGRVLSSRLVSGSGSSLLDAGARQTIRRANPFPPFPKGLGKRRMTFVVPIRFRVR